jgi:hypothetical protein
METTHKQEYHIRDIATRSVTLFPNQAQVSREIKDVPLKVSVSLELKAPRSLVLHS